MKIKGRVIVFMIMGLAVLCFVGTSGTLLAAEVPGVPDQDRTQAWRDDGQHLEEPMLQQRDRDRIMDDTGLPEAEMVSMEPELAEAVALSGGDTGPVRKMIQKAVGENCVGDCLMERLRNWNRNMEQKQVSTKTQDTAMNREQDRDSSSDSGGSSKGSGGSKGGSRGK